MFHLITSDILKPWRRANTIKWQQHKIEVYERYLIDGQAIFLRQPPPANLSMVELLGFSWKSKHDLLPMSDLCVLQLPSTHTSLSFLRQGYI